MKFSNISNIFSTGFIFSILFLSLNVLANPNFDNKDISEVGWSVTFIEAVYDPVSDTTTFVYSLNAGADEKDLSHWVLAIDMDLVTIVSVMPTELTSYGLDPTTNVTGIKWDAGQDAGTTQTYTVVVDGEVEVADVNYSVKGGTYYAIGGTQGPGGDGVITGDDTYSISGSIYIDANHSATLNVGEPLVSDVSVELYDDEGNLIATAVSGTSGLYVFSNIHPGNYNVSVPAATTSEDFNETLSSHFNPVYATDVEITLTDADITHLDFGFSLDARAILDDLNQEDPDGDGFSFSGEGRTIGFWKHQISVAIKGKGRSHIDSITMMNYLIQLESFQLPIPFQFGDGSEYADAFQILATRSSMAVDLLEKQLLATELNHLSGMGLSGDAVSLQQVILAWSEFLAANHSEFSRDELLAAKDILDLINNLGH